MFSILGEKSTVGEKKEEVLTTKKIAVRDGGGLRVSSSCHSDYIFAFLGQMSQQQNTPQTNVIVWQLKTSVLTNIVCKRIDDPNLGHLPTNSFSSQFCDCRLLINWDSHICNCSSLCQKTILQSLKTVCCSFLLF